jgi:hypothetical protein
MIDAPKNRVFHEKYFPITQASSTFCANLLRDFGTEEDTILNTEARLPLYPDSR